MFLLITIHVQPALVLSVWVDYCLNNDYIREVLCINKERPKLECDGKCYLAQQLNQKSQKKDSQEKGIVSDQSFTPVFFVDIQNITFESHTISILSTENFHFSNNYKLLRDKERDRPPNFS